MKILVIEDDVDVSKFLKEELKAKRHLVETFSDGSTGSYHARTNQYDAIILDYSLPGKDGITVCKEIRNSGKSTPIIFLSATTTEQTKISALDIGADDYMVKPFSFNELESRLKAITRRPANIQKTAIEIGCLSIDTNKQTVTKDGEIIRLSKKEFAIIEFLIKNSTKTISRAELMDHVWSAEVDPFSNTVEAHIRLLRKKIGKKDGNEIIKNISGRGYRIEA